jgi:hypothetical protein
MNTVAIAPSHEVRVAPSANPQTTRYLYSIAAALLLIVTFLGFQQYYLHGRTVRGVELATPLRGLLATHGVAMTVWLLLSSVQPLLVASGNRRLHIGLGVFGVGLAACIVPLGFWTAIAVAKIQPNVVHSGGLIGIQFLPVQLNSVLLFGTFVTLGIFNRRRPDIHRPLMFLATLAIMGAAFARIAPFRALYAGTIWSSWFGPYFFPIIFGLVFFAAKTALTRSVDRWLAGGMAVLIVADAIAVKIGPTAIWERIGHFLVR